MGGFSKGDFRSRAARRRARHQQRTRASMRAVMFTIVLAVIVTPFAVAWADTASTSPDLAVPTAPADPTTPPTTVAPTTDASTPPNTVAPTTDPTTPPTTAAPTPTSDDGDGVAAAIEDAAPNGGDGNLDGLVDSRQANVASLPAAVDVNGKLDDYVTIVAPEGTTLTNVRALKVPTDPAPPEGVNFAYGLFDYDVHVAQVGDSADVSFILPSGPAPASVFMLQNGAWSEVTDSAAIDAPQKKVTVALQDGAVGDSDKTSDGVIKDPVGVGSPGDAGTVTNAAVAGGTITAHKGGLRNTGTNDTDLFASGLQGATFEYANNSNFTSPTALCVTPASTDVNGVCVSAAIANGNYWVREKTAPAGWNTIPAIAYGGDAFSQSPLVNYNQQVSINNSNATTRRFVNRKTNPTLPAGCGLNVSLVLDRSGSIAPNSTTYATAAKSFVDTLAGTPSSMKIFSFAASASTDQGSFLSLSTAGNVTSLKNTIDSVYASAAGGTNWDAGLQLAITSGSNLVVFITDGNPTARNGDTSSTNLVDLADVEYGIASANSVKNAGQTIWAIGVAAQGSGGITPTNLELVSGPGDFFTADLTTIQNQLKSLANQLCGSRIHVRKLVGGVPQTGWSFTAAGGGAGVTFNNNPGVTAGVNGDVQITVDNIPATGAASAVTVAESLVGHTGYSLAQAACQLNSYPAQDTGNSTNPQSIAQIQRNQDWYCTFNNVQNPGTVSGQKWEDKNANGVKDAGDNGLQNWHVRVFDSGGAQVGSDLVTDASGNFSVQLTRGYVSDL